MALSPKSSFLHPPHLDDHHGGDVGDHHGVDVGDHHGGDVDDHDDDGHCDDFSIHSKRI